MIPVDKALEIVLGHTPMLPLWLTPTQVRIVPVGGDQLAYARSLLDRLPALRELVRIVSRSRGFHHHLCDQFLVEVLQEPPCETEGKVLTRALPGPVLGDQRRRGELMYIPEEALSFDLSRTPSLYPLHRAASGM